MRDAIQCYIEFVMSGVGKTVWDDLQHQKFLGEDVFIEKHQLLLDGHTGDYFGLYYSKISRIIAK